MGLFLFFSSFLQTYYFHLPIDIYPADLLPRSNVAPAQEINIRFAVVFEKVLFTMLVLTKHIDPCLIAVYTPLTTENTSVKVAG